MMSARKGELTGKRIAVLVENEFIPEELTAYSKRFGSMGAQVEFMSRLWNSGQVTFYSALDPLTYKPGQHPVPLDVSIDFEKVELEDYAAVIMSANYTSLRLRYFDTPHNQVITPAMTRNSPAVRFFARAMRNNKIVKGALCHGLWILTPVPEIMTGRKVMCHEVVLADIVNAGAHYTPSGKVVVDNDLVTGHSKDDVDEFIDRIAEQILSIDRSGQIAQSSSDLRQVPRQPGGGKRVLVLLSEWGYWGEELVGPIEVLDAAGYQVDFMTPTGRRPNAITVSMDPDYIDPPLGRSVTDPHMAEKVSLWDDPTTQEGARLEGPLSLAGIFPDRPYWSAPQHLHSMELYYKEVSEAQLETTMKYDALLIVGGSGPIVDLANNHRVHDLILGFYAAHKPIASECYGVACLPFARDLETRKSIIWGKHVTGHCKEYDYMDGTGFMKERGKFLDFNMGPPPYPLEYILRDATGPDGGYHGNFGKPTSVIVDYPFITGRSTPDSTLTGLKLVEVLEGAPPLRRWGW